MIYDINVYYIIIAILLMNNIMCFYIGYLVSLSKTVQGVSIRKNIFRKNNTELSTKEKIQIDDKKFVTDIKTDNLEKKYKDLGDIKKSSDNISSSINKLKNMKG